jgi:hypothetical protein
MAFELVELRNASVVRNAGAHILSPPKMHCAKLTR